MIGGITSLTRYPIVCPLNNARGLRLTGTFELRNDSLARNYATFQNNTG